MTTSPAGIVFGPVLGLLVFSNVVSRLLLVVTAWTATLREREPDRMPEPALAIVRPTITISARPGAATTGVPLQAGALLAVLGGVFAWRARPTRGPPSRADHGSRPERPTGESPSGDDAPGGRTTRLLPAP